MTACGQFSTKRHLGLIMRWNRKPIWGSSCIGQVSHCHTEVVMSYLREVEMSAPAKMPGYGNITSHVASTTQSPRSSAPRGAFGDHRTEGCRPASGHRPNYQAAAREARRGRSRLPEARSQRTAVQQPAAGPGDEEDREALAREVSRLRSDLRCRETLRA